MMARNDCNHVFDQELSVEIISNNCLNERRNISIIVNEFVNYIHLKIRDSNKFCFNYTSKIDLSVFDQMKKQQSLDINFSEFKTHLLEMLHQSKKQEMYIRCETEDLKCKMIFYGKSKIKNLIFLIIDFTITDQNEVFDEMNTTILSLQDTNKMLHNQLKSSTLKHQDYEERIKNITTYNRKLLTETFKQIQKVEHLIPSLIIKFNNKIDKELHILEKKLVKLRQDLSVVQNESILKSASSARLLQTMESLRQESMENSRLISDLKRENFNLQSMKRASDNTVTDLKQTVNDKDRSICDLQKEMEVLKKDLQDATIILAQKTKSNDELAKDLVQANQMLVNFNNHYDMKAKEVEELQKIVNAKESLIKDKTQKFTELLKEYQEYKNSYNLTTEQKISHELFLAHKRIEELEKQNREASKLNGLLTKKLSAGSMINFEKM